MASGYISGGGWGDSPYINPSHNSLSFDTIPMKAATTELLIGNRVGADASPPPLS